MKLILTHDVEKLGSAGDVVEVKDGYARNFLIPRKLAVKWTKGAGLQLKQMAAARRKREITSIEDARAVRDTLQSALIELALPATENGRLFGSASTADIADAVKAQLNQTIDRRKVVIDAPIKTIGNHEVTVNLHADVVATVKLLVLRG
ncbi:50S ribosomal protein L9 [Boudabousia marimammalium]|uniref:Large ribosomal subunit protein bL9 n=1 Tax=Boudabousia marimammalium TaxID=156892 RepID=A0A1Q5PSP4_9ACTO|nr:50S ribosomal protein L9 [Boudabousia marimammalium]OKL50576.1 50S ribosomal protein L9 [Boudabousia marimammalium]